MQHRRLAVVAAIGSVLLGVISAFTPANATTAAAVTAATPSPKSGNAHWKLVFKDDFTHGLAPHAWDVYTQGGSSNARTETFTPSHVTVSGGQLHIRGYVDRKAKNCAACKDGRIVTGGLGLWQRPMLYGKYEVLVRMQPCAQVKYAWMLWPYNNNWPKDGEIDFAEDEGGNRAMTTASLSYAGKNGEREVLKHDDARPRGGFSAWHVLGVEWTPGSVRYTMDGKYWGSTKTTHIPHTPMVFVMQTEGLAMPNKVALPGGSCTADVGWVAQWSYRR